MEWGAPAENMEMWDLGFNREKWSVLGEGVVGKILVECG